MLNIATNLGKENQNHWGTTSNQSEWLSSKCAPITNVGEDVVKRETSYTVGGNIIGIATMENSSEVSQKSKNRTTTWPAIPLLGVYPKKYQKHYFKKIQAPQGSQQHYYSCQGKEAN